MKSKQTKHLLGIPLVFLMLSMGLQERKSELFVLGDSISEHYGKYLEGYLKEDFSFDRKRDDLGLPKSSGIMRGSNGGDSRSAFAYLTERFKDSSFSPDVLLLNCGLHDIKVNPKDGSYQVNSEDYKKNLKAILELTKDKNVKLVWVRTTAVVDTIHNPPRRKNSFQRHVADVIAYNKIADSLMHDANIPVIDLYTFTRNIGGEISYIDHVHYKDKVRELQAAYIAGSLRSICGKSKN
ncbi:SGNH/GDSL hydrolase family protein [Yeosuana marina]|uniref:SGNH/GDSL hydrolase family protein n=1 Tax=Yeosuana marina TaxID=1565536 RepID=UPI0030C885F6